VREEISYGVDWVKIYVDRMNTYEYSETKTIHFENRSWGSPKLFGEVQISLIEKQD
jgi:hypothetical protein